MVVSERTTEDMPASDLAEVIAHNIARHLMMAVMGNHPFGCKVEANDPNTIMPDDNHIIGDGGKLVMTITIDFSKRAENKDE